MLTNIALIIIVAYIISKFISGPAPKKTKEFVDLTKSSVKELGGRGTVHALIDGVFDGAKAGKDFVADKARSMHDTTAGRVSALKPQDYKYDPESGELIIFLNKSEDLVLGRDGRRCYALEMSVTGRATEISGKALERKLRYLSTKGKLSESQERAIKDWFAKATR